MSDPVAVARALYEALGSRDVATLAALLDPSFTGRVSDGMPLGVGGRVGGPQQMLLGVWGSVAAEYDTAPVPDEFVAVGGGRVIVLGWYRGTHRRTGRDYTAAFAHDLVIVGGRVASLVQVTDTASWHAAASA